MGELWIIDTKLSSEKSFSSGSDYFVNRVVISRFGEFCKRYSSWSFHNPPVTSSFGKYESVFYLKLLIIYFIERVLFKQRWQVLYS